MGTPAAPSVPIVAAGLGQSALTWTAPAYNARIATIYSLQLLDSADKPAGSAVPLKPTTQGEGTATGAVFTATHEVVPGEWKYQLLTENAHGNGAPSPPTAVIRSREWRQQGCKGCAA